MFSNGSNGKISENMMEIPLPPYEGKYFKDFVGPHQGKNNFQCIFASFELIQQDQKSIRAAYSEVIRLMSS